MRASARPPAPSFQPHGQRLSWSPCQGRSGRSSFRFRNDFHTKSCPNGPSGIARPSRKPPSPGSVSITLVPRLHRTLPLESGFPSTFRFLSKYIDFRQINTAFQSVGITADGLRGGKLGMLGIVMFSKSSQSTFLNEQATLHCTAGQTPQGKTYQQKIHDQDI